MSFWDEKEAKRLFQKLPTYKVLIEKPRIKLLKNIDLLHELPLYDKLSIEKISKKKLRNWIIDLKDPLAQLEASQPSVKDLCKDLLHEIKGFKYQIAQ